MSHTAYTYGMNLCAFCKAINRHQMITLQGCNPHEFKLQAAQIQQYTSNQTGSTDNDCSWGAFFPCAKTLNPSCARSSNET